MRSQQTTVRLSRASDSRAHSSALERREAMTAVATKAATSWKEGAPVGRVQHTIVFESLIANRQQPRGIIEHVFLKVSNIGTV